VSDEKRITAIEEELKVLKNEIKAVLLDIREHYLSVQSPFAQSVRVINEDDSDDEDVIGISNNGSKNESKVAKEKQPLIGSNNTSPGKSCAKEMGSDSDGSTLLNTILPGIDADSDMEFADYEEDIEPKSSRVSHKKKAELKYSRSNEKVDLVIIAALTQWVEQATAMLGKERVEALVEVSCTMRHFPAEIKDVLIKLIRLSHFDNDNGKTTSAKDYLAILAQLDSLLGSEHQDEALLSILSMIPESKNG